MDGIAESPMEIVNLPLNVKVGFYGDSGPPAVKMAIDRESPTNAGIALPRLLELAIADAFAKFCNEPLHFITRFLNSLSCQHLRTSVYRHALLTAAPAVTLARIRPNPVPSTLPRRPRFLLRPAANHPIPSRTHFPVRRRAGKLSCGSALRAEPHSCALLFPWKLPPLSQPGRVLANSHACRPPTDPCRGRDFPNCHWSLRLREKSDAAMPVRSCAARTVNRARQAVLHQPAPHFLHGDDGRFLGRRGQHRPRTALQLPGALCRYDDEPVSALFRIVRNSAV